MRVLLDSCVCGGAASELRSHGVYTVWVGDWPRDPGDEEILRRAHEDRRILVTLDKDFGELATVRGRSHSGIVRLVNLSARDQGRVCIHVLDEYEKELSRGAIVTVQPGRLRIRPAEMDES